MENKKRNKRSNDDKTLIKIEKYVEKNREKTYKNISEKRWTRKIDNNENNNLETMINKLHEKTKVKKKSPTIAKWILYLIYIMLICISIYIFMKYFIQ